MRTRIGTAAVLATFLAVSAQGGPSRAALASPGVTNFVSVDSAEVQRGGENLGPSISADGRYVAFDTNGTYSSADKNDYITDVYVRDVVAGTTILVSVNLAGRAGNGDSGFPSISADGRYVAFTSDATDLLAEESQVNVAVYRRDLAQGITRLVSIDYEGIPMLASNPVISGNGRYVLFTSDDPGVAGDTNRKDDVFVRDVVAGVTTRVSVGAGGRQGNGPSGGIGGFAGQHYAISFDGRYVAFRSSATNLVSDDTNADSDVFVRDRVAGTTVRVSVGPNGEQGVNGYMPAISAAGDRVVFGSDSTWFADDDNEDTDIFVRDLKSGKTELVSRAMTGEPGNGASIWPAISGDGRFVSFRSWANNFMTVWDADGWGQIFLRDLESSRNEMVSVTTGGFPGEGFSYESALSGDGRYIAFSSWANDLLPDDRNEATDVFLRDRLGACALPVCPVPPL